MYSSFSAIIAFSSLAITRDKDAFSSYLVRIEALSVVFSVFKLTLVKAINRFSAVFSVSVKSLT
jgi:hypothetical protein